jgi:hypothetical protein
MRTFSSPILRRVLFVVSYLIMLPTVVGGSDQVIDQSFLNCLAKFDKLTDQERTNCLENDLESNRRSKEILLNELGSENGDNTKWRQIPA